MREHLRSQLLVVAAQLLIVAAAGVIFFTNLGGAALWDMDEALYASCAREMFDRSDWVVPWFNDQMFPEKPPLMFWTMMAGFQLFGVDEWGARFFSAVLGVGTALVAFHLGRILSSLRVGLWTGLITASTIIFTVSARAATVDSALTFVTALAMLLFVIARNGTKGSGFRVQRSALDGTRMSNPETRTLNPEPFTRAGDSLKLPYAILMYACIGLAVLAKGPVGMLLPLAAIVFYLLVANVDRPAVALMLLYAIVAGSMLGECVGLLVGRWVTPMRLLGMLPAVVALGWCLLAAGGWRNLLRSVWLMRPLTGIIVVAAVALPWYWLVGVRTEGRWLREFFLEFNLRPFRQPIQGHGVPSSLDRVQAAAVSCLYYFFHVPGVLVGFFPWAVFLGAALVDAGKKVSGPSLSPTPSGIRRPTGVTVLTLLSLCWFSVWFVFWSLCKTKLPHYLLPAYPALALLTAQLIDRWLAEPADIGRWTLRNAWISTILVGVGLMIALPIAASIYLPGEEALGLVGVILILGGGWCWWKTAHDRHQAAALGLLLSSIVFLTAVFGFAALRVDRHQNARPMIAAIRADAEEKRIGPVRQSRPEGASHKLGPSTSSLPIATYRFFRWSTVFYAGHPVTECDNDDATNRLAWQELQEFFVKSPRSYVITTDEYERELAEQFPGKFREIFRQPCFLREGEMVVLAAF